MKNIKLNKLEHETINNKFKITRNKLFLIIILVVIIICFIVGAIILNNQPNFKKSDNESIQNENINGQIDMNKKENVDIKNGVKENISEELLKDKDYKGLILKNIKFFSKNGITKFTAIVENVSGKDFKGQKIKIILKNKDGSQFGLLNAYINDMKIGEKTEIDSATSADLTNAYTFTIE